MYDSVFLNLANRIVPISEIISIDISQIHDSVVTITTRDGLIDVVHGFFAIELVWALKPGALEGNSKLKWMKGMWIIHNFIGHPLMQILALFKQYKMAIWVHDITVPKPIGARR